MTANLGRQSQHACYQDVDITTPWAWDLRLGADIAAELAAVPARMAAKQTAVATICARTAPGSESLSRPAATSLPLADPGNPLAGASRCNASADPRSCSTASTELQPAAEAEDPLAAYALHDTATYAGGRTRAAESGACYYAGLWQHNVHLS